MSCSFKKKHVHIDDLRLNANAHRRFCFVEAIIKV